ncbi:hypothetical protein MANES_06G031750v8 [Manihot esculenta]|uniref:Uncharacterized protein n=1 Tax=Manihot esculenta TaxID=3983 RepID=A0ACB7HJJ5_MANES|nr:hypothetical protein MANES_06G031750v8 [Manihot esculenta]
MQGQCPAKESLILLVDCFLDLTEWFWVGRGRSLSAIKGGFSNDLAIVVILF